MPLALASGNDWWQTSKEKKIFPSIQGKTKTKKKVIDKTTAYIYKKKPRDPKRAIHYDFPHKIV